jgi:hypothetical protein
MRRPRPTRSCCAVDKKDRKIILKYNFIQARKFGRIKGLMTEMRGQSLLM